MLCTADMLCLGEGEARTLLLTMLAGLNGDDDDDVVDIGPAPSAATAALKLAEDALAMGLVLKLALVRCTDASLPTSPLCWLLLDEGSIRAACLSWSALGRRALRKIGIP